MSKKKIANLRVWSSPPIAGSVERMLADAFPEYEVETTSIGKLLRRKPVTMLMNELFVARYYGWGILNGSKQHKDYRLATPYLFRQARKLILERFAGKTGDYAFSFQLQSLFDTSLPGLPHFVYTDHTALANLDYPGFDRANLYAAPWIALERSIYHNASRVFTRSSNISRSVVSQYGLPLERVYCVYAGSNTPPVSAPVSGDRYSGRYARKHILFVGIDWERKGGPDLVAAFRKALEAHPYARLTIVGANPPVDLPNVRVAGRVPLAELPAYYQDASLFCMPTRQEPFGVAFLEALGYGLPVVATRIGAIPDFVIPGQTGCLVSPGDISGLAAALVELLSDSRKCQEFGENGRRLVEERYTWRRVGERVREEVLGAIAARS